MENRIFSVWVGGTEVNEYLLGFTDALLLAEAYKDDGYDDVQIENVTLENK